MITIVKRDESLRHLGMLKIKVNNKRTYWISLDNDGYKYCVDGNIEFYYEIRNKELSGFIELKKATRTKEETIITKWGNSKRVINKLKEE